MRQDVQIIFWALVLAMNLCGFLLMGKDKRLAQNHMRRIPEKTLFTVAALFGSVGVFVGMQVFRHKTKHLSFNLGVPALFTLQAALVMTYYYFYPQIKAVLAMQ
ncbi:MAG: DUF1294 domain-containing protein [Eubacteriales bacterium]|nr:DUF1294 domain-containing protein [Eubacteriales bacterium]